MSGRPPLHGYNTNYRRDGTLYHVQTEDLGEGIAAVVTQVFNGGVILVTRRTDYRHLVGSEGVEPSLQKTMQQQHKEVLLGLRDGTLDMHPLTESEMRESMAGRGLTRHDTMQMEIPPEFLDAPDPDLVILEIEAGMSRLTAVVSEPPVEAVADSIDFEPLNAEMTAEMVPLPLAEPGPEEQDGGSLPAPPQPLPESSVSQSSELSVELIPLPARPSTLPLPAEPEAEQPLVWDRRPSGQTFERRRDRSERPAKLFNKISRPTHSLGEDRLGEEQLGERSLDEVILSYLAEDLQEDS